MVIDHFNFVRVTLPPLKANAPLTVHTDAVGALAISLQELQPVPWERGYRSQVRRRIKHIELAKNCALDGLKPAHRLPAEQPLRIAAAEGSDHIWKVY
jgi:hypothetical protein